MFDDLLLSNYSGGDYNNKLALTFEQCCRKASKLGQSVVLPSPHQLFLDIDSKEQFDRFLQILPRVSENEETKLDYVLSPSKDGGHHFHIIVDMKREVNALERIAYQAILGSDPVREIISLRRLRSGNQNPTVFFEHATVENPK